jgi:hypothetical protein
LLPLEVEDGEDLDDWDIVLPGFWDDGDVVLPGFWDDGDVVLP